MHSVRCEFIRESSRLSVKFVLQGELVLSSFLLSAIINELKGIMDESARELLRQILGALDDLWLNEKEKGFEVCRFFPRTLITIFGKVFFRYRQAKKDGKYHRPLLEMLGIENYQRITEDLIDLVRRSALYTSYRKALKIGGHICALSTLWTAVQKEGISYRKRLNNAVYYYLEGESSGLASPSDFAVVMIDEIWLRKKRMKVLTTAPEKKKKQYIKVKVLRCSVAHKKEDTYEWEPLRVLASAQGDQKGFLHEARRFLNATVGLERIPHLMVLTDGCDMGRNFCALYPGQAVWQLDWWHLFDHVHKGCKFEKDLESEVIGLISIDKVDAALALLHAYHVAMMCMETKLEKALGEISNDPSLLIKPKVFWSTRQRENLEKCITYLENNKDGIFGVKKFKDDIPAEFLAFGTGPLERLQAVMIAYRMKKQGKSWSIQGADNLIQLLSREWNGEALEHIIEEGLEGLSAWEAACLPHEQYDSGSSQSQSGKKRKPRMDFSPLPEFCVPILQRGRTDSFFTPLKRIGELKLIPSIVDFREEGCPNV